MLQAARPGPVVPGAPRRAPPRRVLPLVGLVVALVCLAAGLRLTRARPGTDGAIPLPADALVVASADMDGDGRPEVAARFFRRYPARIRQEEDEIRPDYGQWVADGEQVVGIYTSDGAGGRGAIWEQAEPSWHPEQSSWATSPQDLPETSSPPT